MNNLKILNACYTRDIDFIKRLIGHAELDAQDINGQTALTISSIIGASEIAQLLIKNGANIEHKNKRGETSLIAAAKSPFENQKDTVEVLIDSGAIIDAVDNYGFTPLMYAAEFDHYDVVNLLLNNGASIDIQNEDGYTALMRVSHTTHIDIAMLLMDSGADLELKNNKGNTALMIAHNARAHKDLVGLFISNGANVNQQNIDGNTLLIDACIAHNRKDILFFIKNGGDLLIKNNEGNSGFDILNQIKGLDSQLLSIAEKSILDKSITDEQDYCLGL